MAKSRIITVPADMSPQDVLEKAHKELEGDGFGWEQQSLTEAVAYERGKKTTSKSSSYLRMRLQAAPGQLTVTRETDGASGYLFSDAGPVIQGLLFSKFSKVIKRLDAAVGA